MTTQRCPASRHSTKFAVVSSWPPLNQPGPVRSSNVTTPSPAASFCGHSVSPASNVGNWWRDAIGSQPVVNAARVSGRRPSPRMMPAHSFAWSAIVVSIEPAARTR